MNSIKKAGIWMDHSSANVIEFKADRIETKVISELCNTFQFVYADFCRIRIQY